MKVKSICLYLFQMNIINIFCSPDAVTISNSLKFMKFGTQLEGTLIDRAESVSLLSCVKACLVRPRCKSVNYIKKFFLCELNSGDSTTDSDKIVNNRNEVFYGEMVHWTKELLTDDPCHDVTCPALYKCDQWSSADPPCTLSECGDPVLPSHATSSRDGTAIGLSQTISCNSGFTLVGNERIICQSNGQWSSNNTVCEPDCGMAPIVLNAISDNYTRHYGSVLEYRCEAGHMMSGQGRITCLSGGNWSAVNFTCDEDPECPSHAVRYNKTGQWRCYWILQTERNWEQSNSTCSDDGGTLAIIDNIQQNEAVLEYIWTYYPQSIEKYIWLGFSDLLVEDEFVKVNGEMQTFTNWAPANPSSNMECGAINTKYTDWHDLSCGSSAKAICSRDIQITAECGDPLVQPNAVVLPGTSIYGSTREYTCNSEFIINGIPTVSCFETGQWSIPGFTCDAECPSHAFRYNKTGQWRCYWILQAERTWEQSNTTCSDDGGTLAIIDNINQNTAVLEYIWTYYAQSTELYIWLGFSDQAVENQFVKVTGEMQTYTNWAPANPSLNTECGAINTKYTNWHDLPCGSSRKAMCSRDIKITADCGEPSTQLNAVVLSGNSTYGSTRNYVCNSGFSINGVATVSCLETGLWSTPGFTCVVDCGAPPTYTHSTVPFTTTVPGTILTYSCDSGYVMNGNGNDITCENDGTWSSSDFNCTAIDCGIAPERNNTMVTRLGTSIGSQTTYTCNQGYIADGGSSPSTITCQSDGQWSSTSLNCRDCGDPPFISGSIITGSGNLVGNYRDYSCDVGYISSGPDPSRSSCDAATGQWSNITLACNACRDSLGTSFTLVEDRLFMPPNNFVPSVVGSSVDVDYCKSKCIERTDFVCVVFYIKNTSNPGYCVQWDKRANDEPSYINYYTMDESYDEYKRECSTDCGNPPSKPNAAAVAGTTTVGSNRTYTCNTGYTINGDSTIMCQASGTWSSTSFTCNIINCGNPPSKPNAAAVAGTTTVGSVRTYTCNTGYAINGDSTITCQASGTWSSTSFTCNIIDCGNPQIKTNADLSSGTTTYGSSRTYTCNSGFTASGGSSTINCLSTGSWSTTSFTCVVASCGPPTSYLNANIAYSTTAIGTVLTYTCNSGYVMSGTEFEITCENDGTWSDSDFTCSPVDCGNPQIKTNADLSSGTTTYGSSRTYTCNSGSTGSGGSSTINCLSTGSWSTTSFTCVAASCGPPTSYLNANIAYSTTAIGTVLTYTCNSGYVMSGTEFEITCENDGTWSDSDFTCSPVDCGSPPVVADATVDSGGTIFGSYRTYTCQAGYIPVGANYVTCTASGSWTEVGFYCWSAT